MTIAALLATPLALVMLAQAIKAGDPSTAPRSWAVAIGAAAAAAGSILLVVGRAAYRASTGDRSAQLPGVELLRPVPLVVVAVAGALTLQLTLSAAVGSPQYGDRPGFPGDPAVERAVQGFTFAIFIALFAVPPLVVFTAVVAAIEYLEHRARLPDLAVRAAGAVMVSLATAVVVGSAGAYVALARWAEIPTAVVAGVAMFVGSVHAPENESIHSRIGVIAGALIAFIPYAVLGVLVRLLAR